MEEVEEVVFEENILIDVRGRVGHEGVTRGSARLEYNLETNSVFVRIDHENNSKSTPLSRRHFI
jgi:hypothetical protein